MKFHRSIINCKQVAILGYPQYPRHHLPSSSSSSSFSSSSSSSSGKQNYYDVLGINKSSSRKDIRKAFLEKSKEYHPDSVARSDLSSDQLKNKFQEVNEAYQVLNDPTERRVYDESIKPKPGYFNRNPKWGNHGYGSYNDYQQYRAHQEFMRNQGQYWANYNRQNNQGAGEFTWKSFFQWKMGQPMTVANFLLLILMFGIMIEVIHTAYLLRYFKQSKKERIAIGPGWYSQTRFDEKRADEAFERSLIRSKYAKNETEDS